MHCQRLTDREIEQTYWICFHPIVLSLDVRLNIPHPQYEF